MISTFFGLFVGPVDPFLQTFALVTVHLFTPAVPRTIGLKMPSHSFLLGVGTVLSTLSSTAFAAPYQLKETYTADNWLQAFEFKQYDKNFGFVNYVDEATARQKGMYYKNTAGDIMFGVDSSEQLNYQTDVGRKSVRLEGRKNYNQGLFIIDIKTMPAMCGMWPAFWSLGQEPWPVRRPPPFPVCCPD